MLSNGFLSCKKRKAYLCLNMSVFSIKELSSHRQRIFYDTQGEQTVKYESQETKQEPFTITKKKKTDVKNLKTAYSS